MDMAKADSKKTKAKTKTRDPGGRSSGAAKSKKKRATLAAAADRYALYQSSVQTPSADVEFFDRVFRRLRGRRPRSLREDFCGTGYLSATWVQSHRERTATGVDIDPEPLAWGQAHNMAELSPKAASRVRLLEADVLDGVGDAAEVACAMNFSYGVFKERALLKRYFQVVYDKLTPDGVFFTELYGGTEAIIDLVEERPCEGFTYIWEQETYNPINHQTVCHIHFRFPDKSRVDRAFSYDWRLWTIPEICELLAEVGFKAPQVYWETTDDDGDGTGDFEPTETEENQESWLVYIVAAK